jgi:hypothetical protein
MNMGINRLIAKALHSLTRPLRSCLSPLKASEGQMNLDTLTPVPMQYLCKQLPAQRLCSRSNTACQKHSEHHSHPSGNHTLDILLATLSSASAERKRHGL